jgi:WhiB family transcriptional regulator, redox-sensing transcriptional regulator
MPDTNHDDVPSWQFRAACRGEDTALFFAPNYFEQRQEKEAREAKAKRICHVCPVRIDCLEYALRIREPYGVWGGLNESERRTLLRERERRAVS